MYKRSSCYRFSPTFGGFLLFHFSYSSECILASHLILTCIFLMSNNINNIFMCLFHMYLFFVRCAQAQNVYYFYCMIHIFIEVYFCKYCGFKFFIRYVLQKFFPGCELSFISTTESLEEQWHIKTNLDLKKDTLYSGQILLQQGKL